MGQGGSRQSEEDNINTVLGRRAGVLELVFGHLSLQDLKNVSLVCQLWRQAGERLLWDRGVLRVTRKNITRVMEALGDHRRLRAVRKLAVNGQRLSEELLQAVAGHQGLGSVNMAYSDLTAVEPELLASIVTSLDNVNLLCSQVTKQQLEAIFTSLSVGTSCLKTLYISHNKLASIEAGLLARAVNSLEDVVLHDTQLSKQQAEAILSQSLRKTSLRRLGMKYEGLDENLVARARLVINNVFGVSPLWASLL